MMLRIYCNSCVWNVYHEWLKDRNNLKSPFIFISFSRFLSLEFPEPLNKTRLIRLNHWLCPGMSCLQNDFNILLFCRRGILDIFLSTVAKNLNMQMKAKNGTNGKTLKTVCMSDYLHPECLSSEKWYFKGTICKELSIEVNMLLKDMSMVSKLLLGKEFSIDFHSKTRLTG